MAGPFDDLIPPPKPNPFADLIPPAPPAADAPASFDQRFAAPEPAGGDALHAGLERRAAELAPRGPVAAHAVKALEPITSYLPTQDRMQREARNLMSEGADQAARGGVANAAIGAGKVALGGLNYVTSPVNAALHTIVGRPIEENFGVPSVLTETAAGFALPFPKRIPLAARGTPKAAIPTAEELKAAAQAGYESPEIAALAVKPSALQAASIRMRAALDDAGLDSNLAPKTHGVLAKTDAATPPGAVVTGKNLESLRRTLGHAAQSPDPVERKAATAAIGAIDEFVASLSKTDVLAGDAAKVAETLADARGNYAAAMRSERVTGALERAEQNAAVAHSGQNIDNAVRQRIRAIVQNPKLRQGFSRAEIAQMDRIMRGLPAGNLLRGVSNILGGGGGLGATVSGTVLSPVAPAVGWALKKLGNRITGGGVERLDEMVRSRSPLASHVGRPLQRWGQAAQAAEGSATPQNLARLAIVSSELSRRLRDVGIDVDPSELSGLASPPAQVDGREDGRE
ncbi:hypothetical protein GJ689_24970 [Rhodoplanes serenus]|uniref:Uncharacterized protein n=1 Tax=Rhodoplanes serenus TaxID=200615 RepID=A0A9X4XQA6_9BRAD|nr:hypothetical protein [Rhodoplanes serenus]MTW19448.1 hypothetical protein [Rhodoplanes serenus]